MRLKKKLKEKENMSKWMNTWWPIFCIICELSNEIRKQDSIVIEYHIFNKETQDVWVLGKICCGLWKIFLNNMLPHCISDIFTSLVVLRFIPFVILEFNYLYWKKHHVNGFCSFLKESANTAKGHTSLFLVSVICIVAGEKTYVYYVETVVLAKAFPILDKWAVMSV